MLQTYEDHINLFKSFCAKPSNRNQEGEGENKYFGYHCIFTPEEIIHAAGFTPLRMFPEPKTKDLRDKCLHARSCEYARKLMESFEVGQFDFLKGAVFTQCCDVLNAVYDVLSLKQDNLLQLNTPLGEQIDYDYFKDEYSDLADSLKSDFAAEVSEESLANSINIYNENRSLMKELSGFYAKGKISTVDYMHVNKAGYYLRKEQHSQHLKNLLTFLEEYSPEEEEDDCDRTPIVLAGGLNANHEWVEYLEDFGVRIVADDLCSLSRAVGSDDPETEKPEDPYQFLVSNVAQKSCPVKTKASDRLNKLVQTYEESKAKGIIFIVFQYCDPQHMDFAEMNIFFKEKNIPALLLPSHINFEETGQLETRIEAFLEMVNFR